MTSDGGYLHLRLLVTRARLLAVQIAQRSEGELQRADCATMERVRRGQAQHRTTAIRMPLRLSQQRWTHWARLLDVRRFWTRRPLDHWLRPCTGTACVPPAACPHSEVLSKRHAVPQLFARLS